MSHIASNHLRIPLNYKLRRSPSPKRYDYGDSPTRQASPPKQITTRPGRSSSQRRMSRERTHSISPTRVNAAHVSPVRQVRPVLEKQSTVFDSTRIEGQQSTPQMQSRKLSVDLDISIIPTETGDNGNYKVPYVPNTGTVEKPKRTISRTDTITKGKRPVLDKTIDLNDKATFIANPRDRSISKERPTSKSRVSGTLINLIPVPIRHKLRFVATNYYNSGLPRPSGLPRLKSGLPRPSRLPKRTAKK